jgi:hypothetical protein
MDTAYRPPGVGGGEEKCTWQAQDPGVPSSLQSTLDDIAKKLERIGHKVSEQVCALPSQTRLSVWERRRACVAHWSCKRESRPLLADTFRLSVP